MKSVTLSRTIDAPPTVVRESMNELDQFMRASGFDEVHVRGDSELIVKQVKGAWDTNDPELREFRVRARELLARFDEWTLEHVPREINARADELANEALDDA